MAANNKISEKGESGTAAATKDKTHTKQRRKHTKKLAPARETRPTKQKNTAKETVSTNPLDRPTTEAEWVDAQAIDSKMMRRLRKEIVDDTKSKISLSKTGLMIYIDPTKLIKRIVVPEHLQAVVCYMHHNMDLSAHQGAKRAMASIARSYYWPGIPTFVRKYVKSCSFCTRRKASRKENAGMSIAQLSKRPGQVFQIDIWGPLPE